MDFGQLTKAIEQTHSALVVQATKSVNICLTLKNWLIGYRIQEYELNGSDRAVYGQNVIEHLAKELTKQKIPHCSRSRLWDYRHFYKTYPEILQALPGEFKHYINHIFKDDEILQSVTGELMQPEEIQVPRLPITTLFRALSYTHFVELIKIEDSLKRSFYEIETVRGNWSSRELKRQIGSLYYERSGLSKNKNELAKFAHEDAHQLTPKDIIRDPYV